MRSLSMPSPWSPAAPPEHDHLAMADRWRERRSPLLSDVACVGVRALKRYHPIRFEGAERLPAGPALLVGNHGLMGYEALFFFEEIYRRTGRRPVGLADRWFFRVPVLRDLLVRLGGAYGHRSNATRLLGEGNLVVCYPGGAREAFKTDARDRYRLRWEQSLGFVRIALECGVPVVPFAAAGVDDTFDIVGHYEGLGRRWMNHDKYDVPRLEGLGGMAIPRPVPFLFRVGEPMTLSGEATEGAVLAWHREVSERAQRLLDETVAAWGEVATGAGAP